MKPTPEQRILRALAIHGLCSHKKVVYRTGLEAEETIPLLDTLVLRGDVIVHVSVENGLTVRRYELSEKYKQSDAYSGGDPIETKKTSTPRRKPSMENGEDKNRVQLAQNIKSIQDNMAAHIELSKMQAKLKRIRYDALIEQGFNEQQALILCEKP